MNQKLEWSGTFEHDRKQVEDVYTEMDAIVSDINTLFEEAKTYWIDDNDTKGKQFKQECLDSFEQVKSNIASAKEGKNALFGALDNTMKEINDETK